MCAAATKTINSSSESSRRSHEWSLDRRVRAKPDAEELALSRLEGGGEETNSRKADIGASAPTLHRRHQRYLTSVVDHRAGAIVWCSPGRNSETLERCFVQLGARKSSIRAVSIDMPSGYEKALRDGIPQAEIAFDPFHVVRLARRVVDQVRPR
jgi:transposase